MQSFGAKRNRNVWGRAWESSFWVNTVPSWRKCPVVIIPMRNEAWVHGRCRPPAVSLLLYPLPGHGRRSSTPRPPCLSQSKSQSPYSVLQDLTWSHWPPCQTFSYLRAFRTCCSLPSMLFPPPGSFLPDIHMARSFTSLRLLVRSP